VRTWVIGAGGLIGSAIHAQTTQGFDPGSIPWSDDHRAKKFLAEALRLFTQHAGNEPWSIIWAAGAGTTVSPDEVFEREISVFEKFMDDVAAGAPAGPGVVALISSAGAVHAGSSRPPFTEVTSPAPISAYGRAKLEQERVATDRLAGRIPLLICRVSNAYGPGQDLTKLQGLVSRLALSTYTREPLHLFVPTSTVRDYIFTSDIADRVHSWIAYLLMKGTLEPTTVVIASGQGTSIAYLVKMAGDVSHRRIPIAMGTHPSSGDQPLDSRFVPTAIPGARDRAATSLPVGVKAVFDDISLRLAQAHP